MEHGTTGMNGSNFYMEYKSELSEWVAGHLLNRVDVWGGYRLDNGKVVLTTNKGQLDKAAVERHFDWQDIGDVVGLHTISPDNTCKHIAYDIDAHDGNADPAANLQWAVRLYLAYRRLGFAVLLEDSNGKGGYHVWVLLGTETPAADAYHFARKVAKDEGVPEHVEVFPKQPGITADRPYGNWLRLFGKHHKSAHVSRFASVSEDGRVYWLKGGMNVAEVLATTATDATVPAYVEPPKPQPIAAPAAPLAWAKVPTSEKEWTEAEIREALSFIPNDGDGQPWQTWFDVMAAVHAWDSTDRGLSVFNDWSRRSAKHQEGYAEQTNWRYLKPNGGITVGTLIWMAKQNGWRQQASEQTTPTTAPTPTTVPTEPTTAPEPAPDIDPNAPIVASAQAEQQGRESDFAISATLSHQLPTYIRNLASYYAKLTGFGKVEARHIFIAIATYAALVGKGVKFHNKGIDIYPNLATVILADTGGSKTNLKIVCSKLLDAYDVEKCNLTTATAEGLISMYSVTVRDTKDLNERKQKFADALTQTSEQPSVTVLSDEFLALTGSILRKDEGAKYARVMCKLLDNDEYRGSTKTDGVPIWGDVCLNIIAMSQVQEFNENLRSAQFKSAGLSGRLIPINENMLTAEMDTTDGNALADMATVAQHLEGKADFQQSVCVFGKGNGDVLGATMARIEQTLVPEHVEGIYDADWKQVRSKILIQGGKVACVLALLNAIEHKAQTAEIDASPFIGLAMYLVYMCHVSNMHYDATVGEDVTRLKQLFTKHGAMTQADIHAYTKWEQYKIKNTINMGTEAGMFEIVKGKGRAVKWQMAKGG